MLTYRQFCVTTNEVQDCINKISTEVTDSPCLDELHSLKSLYTTDNLENHLSLDQSGIKPIQLTVTV